MYSKKGLCVIQSIEREGLKGICGGGEGGILLHSFNRELIDYKKGTDKRKK